MLIAKANTATKSHEKDNPRQREAMAKRTHGKETKLV
jgi:hypothetical protein